MDPGWKKSFWRAFVAFSWNAFLFAIGGTITVVTTWTVAVYGIALFGSFLFAVIALLSGIARWFSWQFKKFKKSSADSDADAAVEPQSSWPEYLRYRCDQIWFCRFMSRTFWLANTLVIAAFFILIVVWLQALVFAGGFFEPYEFGQSFLLGIALTVRFAFSFAGLGITFLVFLLAFFSVDFPLRRGWKQWSNQQARRRFLVTFLVAEFIAAHSTFLVLLFPILGVFLSQ